MAVVVTDLRVTRSEADATTGWTGGGLSVFTADPDPVESTGSLGNVVNTGTVDAYHTAEALDITNRLIYVWALGNGTMATAANIGVAMYVGDGTNNIAFHRAGSDQAAFRHASGPVGWQCLILDGGNFPPGSTARNGSLGALNSTAITRLGVTFTTLSKALGNTANCFVDIIRYSDTTEVLQISGGTSGDTGKFSEVAALDRSTANLRAHGVIRELGTGLFGVQGPLRFGEPTGSASSYFKDNNVSVVFEDRQLGTSRYRIVIRDNGAGTTHFQLGDKVGSGVNAVGSNGCTIIVPSGVGGLFDAFTDTNVTDVFIYGSTLSGFSNGLLFRAGQEVVGSIINASGTLEANGATLVNTDFTASTATRALLWDSNHDTNERLDGCSFLSSGTGHGVEFGPNVPSTLAIKGVVFSGYGADGTTDAAIYNNSGKQLTLQASGGSSGLTVRNGAGASTIIENVQTFSVTGLVAGSEVRVYRNSDGVELAGVESSGTTFSFQYNYTGDVDVDVYIHNVQYVWLGISSTLTATGVTIPVQQRFDRNYSNPV